MQEEIAAFWFRRDLQLHDNAALTHALQSGRQVLCVFIFDKNILSRLEDKKDNRVIFIHRQLQQINDELKKYRSALKVIYGTPLDAWKILLKEYSIYSVYANHDYEPYARERDQQVADFLSTNKCSFHSFKDQVIFEKDEVTKEDGLPYTVFTPYMKKWRAKAIDEKSNFLKSFSTEKYFSNFIKTKHEPFLSLAEIEFKDVAFDFPVPLLDKNLIRKYAETRNTPGIEGTSRLGIHLRFGTVSIRELVRKAWTLSDVWINELIWREFFMQVLWHFPHVAEHAFKKEYERLKWKNDEKKFEKWCNGETGYPIVDAGMRELNETGFMHNRVRMITACFLTKYLLIDWRWGEAYFAQKLLDYELASNNGNWQWSAGTGCDAAPYFRIFNMDAQTKKFDPNFVYIKKWVPEYQELTYPKPIVDYEAARMRCILFYKNGLQR
ncbi:MAG: deoxyribodipyrimidine photo-lyase [Bacteroidota bacterium]